MASGVAINKKAPVAPAVFMKFLRSIIIFYFKGKKTGNNLSNKLPVYSHLFILKTIKHFNPTPGF
ncbi:MAG: hypothetical protein A2Y87_02730 [Bacteroidetes bacterium RBG_13_46_8]|nr:MAG: hypothetical protein A2Y87_02730 [Bacteroidetes bacterium RBG_13_46_8]